ncbi:MAG: signal peptidase I [Cetobacterium sp.]
MKKKIVILLLFYFILREIGLKYLVINLSPSMEKGIYLLKDIKKLKKGDVVLLSIPKNTEKIIYSRKYLPQNIKTLLKQVVAVEGDLIEIADNKLYINGSYVKDLSSKDSRGRVLETFVTNGKLKKDEFFLLGTKENSYDSRYFGAVNRVEILKQAILLKEMIL